MSDNIYKGFEPLGNLILVKLHEPITEKNGIIIPETMWERKPGGVIIARGPNAKALEVGDSILFGGQNGIPVPVDGEDMLLMRDTDPYARVGNVNAKKKKFIKKPVKV